MQALAFAPPVEMKVDLTPEQAVAVKKIFDYSFEEIRERILKEEAIAPDRVDEAILEFRKYFMLIALGNTGLGMTSKEVDEVWHTFILFTISYMDFCNDVFGTYLHHQPNTSINPLPSNSGQKMRDAYHKVFGEVPAIWRGKATGADCNCTTNCQDPDCGDNECRSGN